MTNLLMATQIKDKTKELGFHLVGITSAAPHSDGDFLRQWLGKGYQASMGWIERGLQKRLDPQLVLPGAKTFICVALSYHRGHPPVSKAHQVGHGWISNYAWGDDYHEVLLDRLKKLEEFIKTLSPQAQTKSYVDTGPILERSYAQQAGLGWIGKNTLLINTRMGSFFFLGEILTNIDLPLDQPFSLDHCGTCTRCLDACPTQALTPYELNSNLCISYLTLEHKGPIDPILEKKISPHVAGCDICQDVCPWNRKATLSNETCFDPREGLFNPSLEWLQNLGQEGFSKKFKKNPLKRLKLEGIVRNVTRLLRRRD